MYGKLINTMLVCAPAHIELNGLKIWNPSENQYIDSGWKPIVFTEQPDPEPGFVYVAGWKETSKRITETWTKKEAPDVVSDSEALAELMEVIG